MARNAHSTTRSPATLAVLAAAALGACRPETGSSTATSAQGPRATSSGHRTARPPIPELGWPDVLFVGDRDHGRSDRIEALVAREGFRVLRVAASDLRRADADGKALIVLGRGAGGAAALLRDARAPIVALTEESFSALGLTDGSGGAGVAADQRSVTIADPAHPLGAGVSGHLVVTRFKLPFSWGRPGPSATIVATLSGRRDRAAVFAYEKGAALFGLRAPARRVGFFIGPQSQDGSSPEDSWENGLADGGQTLLAAALRWAATPRALLVAGAVPLSSSDGVVADRLGALGFHVVAVPDRDVTGLKEGRATDVVFVSGSASPGSLVGRLRSSTQPLVVARPELYQRLGLTAAGKDVSGRTDASEVVVLDTGHPVGAGVVGTMTVTRSTQPLGWGRPTRGAKVIAEVDGRPALFALERRARSSGDGEDEEEDDQGDGRRHPTYEEGGAPGQGARKRLVGRRVAWFGGPEAMPELTRGGWALFDAAVLWAAGREMATYVACAARGSASALPPGDGAGSSELLRPILPGASLALGAPGEDAIDFREPQVLEIPRSVRTSAALGVQSVQLTFKGATCARPAGFDADAWTPLRGGDVTCSYARAGSGLPLALQTCTGGLSAHDAIIAAGARLTASPGLPPGGRLQVALPGLGGGELEEPIPPAEAVRLRDGFSWAATEPVPEVDATSRPTLWYIAVHVGSKTERENLALLPRGYSRMPIFRSEFERWRGLRGFMLHRGEPDGRGFFVFSLVTGRLYNTLRDEALRGNPVFRVVVRREVPPEARASGGSVSYDAVPLLRAARATRRPAVQAAARAMGAATPAARVASEEAALLPAAVVHAAAATDAPLTVRTDLRATDPAFSGPVPASAFVGDHSQPMWRAWGPDAGGKIALEGLTVSAMFGGGNVSGPYDSGPTDASGAVTLHVPAGAEIWAVEATMAVPGATLIAEDLTWYGSVEHDFEYWEFPIGTMIMPEAGKTFRVEIQHGWFNMLAQANEGRAFAAATLGMDVPPINISVGALAETMGARQDAKAMFVPCFGTFGPRIVAFIRDRLPTDHWYQDLGLFIASLADLGEEAVGDLYVPVGPADAQTRSRGVVSHEYGHYLVCQMLKQSGIRDPYLTYGQMAVERLSSDLGPGLEAGWMNEGLAELFATQLAGGTNYFAIGPRWVDGPMSFCTTAGSRATDLCLERNYTPPAATWPGDVAFHWAVGRFTTLLGDLLDGQPGFGTGRVWREVLLSGVDPTLVDTLYVYDTVARLRDSGDEGIAIDPKTFPRLVATSAQASVLYANGDPAVVWGVDELNFLTRLDQALAASYSWCDRCRLYALHEDPNIGSSSLIGTRPPASTVNAYCAASARIQSWMPPPPDTNDPASCNYAECTQDRVCFSPCRVVHACVGGLADPCVPGEAPTRTACVDADGDGFYGAQSCIEYCPGEPLPAGYVDSAGLRYEPSTCDADPARYPGAPPVCNQVNCDGLLDCSPTWGCCPGTAYSNVDRGAYTSTNCGYGPLPGVSSCATGTGAATDCQEVASLPTAFHWTGAGAADNPRLYGDMSHGCGAAEGNAWTVSYEQGDDCYAQWGSYFDAVDPGDYTIGVLLQSAESSEVEVDVVTDAGATQLAYWRDWFDKQDGGKCVDFSGVHLEPCKGIEVRVKFIRHWYDPHTLQIWSTSIKKDGMPGPNCW